MKVHRQWLCGSFTHLYMQLLINVCASKNVLANHSTYTWITISTFNSCWFWIKSTDIYKSDNSWVKEPKQYIKERLEWRAGWQKHKSNTATHKVTQSLAIHVQATQHASFMNYEFPYPLVKLWGESTFHMYWSLHCLWKCSEHMSNCQLHWHLLVVVAQHSVLHMRSPEIGVVRALKRAYGKMYLLVMLKARAGFSDIQVDWSSTFNTINFPMPYILRLKMNHKIKWHFSRAISAFWSITSSI